MDSNRPSRPDLIAAALAVGLLPLCSWALGPADPAGALRALLVGYALAALPFAWVVRHWRAWPTGLAGLLLLAGVIRLVLLPVPPLLSEDAWRYLWDGLVQHQGLNPFRYAPNEAALDALGALPGYAEVRREIGHAHIPTIYPPAAQLAFYGAAAFGPALVAIRAMLVVADVAVVAGLWRLATARGRPPQLAALYAFAPVPVLESAVGGHVDALAVAGAVWAAAWIAQGRLGRGGVALAVGIGAKLLPLLAVPTVLRRAPRAVVVAGLALVVMTLPYFDAGELALRGLRAYGGRWRGNDGAFAVLATPFELLWPSHPEPLALPGWLVSLFRRVVPAHPGVEPGQIWADEASFAAAKLSFVAVFGLVWLRTFWRARTLEDLLGPSVITLLLFAPVAHPWYLAWVLAFAAVAHGAAPRPWTWAAWTWAGTAWLAYLPRIQWLSEQQWHEPAWSRALEYAPVWAVLALGALRAVKIRPRPHPSK